MIRPMPKFKDAYPSTVIGTHKIVTPIKLGILSESNLLKKIQKIGDRNHKPSRIFVWVNNNHFLPDYSFSVNSKYPTKEKAQEALVEFLYDYSMKGNIVACNAIKQNTTHVSSLKLIVAPTNDYSYSNINAEVIDLLIQSVDWN